MKAKTPKEIEKYLKGTQEKLKDDEERCARLGTALRPEIAGYMKGAIWAMEWALGKRG